MSPQHQKEFLEDQGVICPDFTRFKQWLGTKDEGDGKWVNIVRLAVWTWDRRKNPRPAIKRMRWQPDPSHEVRSVETGSRVTSAAGEWGAKHHLASEDITFLEKIGFSKASDIALITEEDWRQVPVLTRRRIQTAISD